jgi:hypothetical protein
MTREELLRGVEVYAASAQRSFQAGKDPRPSLSRIKMMIKRYEDLSNTADRAALVRSKPTV